MAVDRKEANLKKLKEADKVQEKTKEAIWRIQRQAAEAEELGTQTLDELRRQGQQMVCSRIVEVLSLVSPLVVHCGLFRRMISILSSSPSVRSSTLPKLCSQSSMPGPETGWVGSDDRL
jgi:hypothetical protein